jgi:hypothetical protein
MLHRRDDPLLTEFFHEPAGMTGDRVGISGVAPFGFTDGGTERIHIHIRNGCKIDIESRLTHPTSHQCGIVPGGILAVHLRAEIQSGRCGGESVRRTQSSDLSPFLIDGKKQLRRTQCRELRGECLHLTCRRDVVRIEDDPAESSFLDIIFDGIGNDGAGKTDHHHLCDLLLKGRLGNEKKREQKKGVSDAFHIK